MAPPHSTAAGGVSGAEAEAADFEALLRPLITDALRLATGMLMNSAEAEDAVQEACLRAWRRRANRRPDTDLRPWFLAIVANQCRETRRGRWWRMGHIDQVASAHSDDPQLSANSIDLRRALSRLRYRTRLVLVLRYYLDLPFDSVAAAAGCSVDSAKALVRRGTVDLARELNLPEVSDGRG